MIYKAKVRKDVQMATFLALLAMVDFCPFIAKIKRLPTKGRKIIAERRGRVVIGYSSLKLTTMLLKQQYLTTLQKHNG